MALRVHACVRGRCLRLSAVLCLCLIAFIAIHGILFDCLFFLSTGPIDQVTDKGMGSAMMQRKRMKNLEPIMRTMRTMLDCPATIKMRMGWSTTEVRASAT